MTKVQQALTNIYNRNGDIRASVVVKAARSKSSPLHNSFEWDDSIASHQYRLEQARSLIRITKIEYKGAPTEVLHVPSVKVTGAPAGGSKEGVYKPIPVIVAQQSDYDRTLTELSNQVTALSVTVGKLVSAKPTKKTRTVGTTLNALQHAIHAL